MTTLQPTRSELALSGGFRGVVPPDNQAVEVEIKL